MLEKGVEEKKEKECGRRARARARVDFFIFPLFFLCCYSLVFFYLLFSLLSILDQERLFLGFGVLLERLLGLRARSIAIA